MEPTASDSFSARSFKMSFCWTVALVLLGTESSVANAFAMVAGTGSLSTPIEAHGTRASHLWADKIERDSIIQEELEPQANLPARREFLQQTVLAASATGLLGVSSSSPAFAESTATDVDGFTVVKTDSGLKYIDLEEGATTVGGRPGATPKYGQLCVISYTGYMQLPKDNKKTKFASQSGFVLKHGNGKLIPGLDEGLHTMRRGGKRRLIIPPKLGFVTGGLGPVPEMPWERRTLNDQLAKMVEQRGGNLVYDVTLERFFDDEADQGYYEDDEISPEEFAELNRRLNRKQSLDAVGNDIEIEDRDRAKPIV
ncbi:unnamed protein product [Pseudo-nitzschia multistriata]|uniref:peptidylprolyl isomerase n=1 Tax=Pseudo-nitzschia multistriata TaxID=183589 RepID=A0A448Z8V6_9STRA|nr:unnamed protein product [Pseudo-nitzschia multistriata]